MTGVFCPVCGSLDSRDIILYDESLRKQDFDISPIFPRCRKCGTPVEIGQKCSGGEIIVLTGTCGSGKSTIAAELAKKHGYTAIDGDCVNQSLKQKISADDPRFRAKVEFNSNETLAEIAFEIDCASIFGDKFVLSHVVLPGDVQRYTEIFSERKLSYFFFNLKPSVAEAIARCQSRTCHKTVTPESYVRHYSERLVFADGVAEIDNTGMTVSETVEKILGGRLLRQSNTAR